MSVNRKTITNTDQFVATMKSVAGKVLLLVRRGEASQFAVVDLTQG